MEAQARRPASVEAAPQMIDTASGKTGTAADHAVHVIAFLEQQLRLTIFDRSAKTPQLTEAGHAMVTCAPILGLTMLAALWEIFGAAASFLVRTLFGKWFSGNAQDQALKAKELEANNLAKPIGSWHDTIDGL